VDRHRIALRAGILTTTVGAACFVSAAMERHSDQPFFQNIWFVIGLATAIASAVLATWSIRVPTVEENHRRTAPITVKYDPSDPLCFQRRTNIPMPDLQLRVQIQNVTKYELVKVRARFTDLPTKYRHMVRIMHDNEPSCPRSNVGVDCSPGDTVYFDVIFGRLGEKRLYYQYANEKLIHTQDREPVYRHTQELSIEFLSRWRDSNTSAPPLHARIRLDPLGDTDFTLTIISVRHTR